MSENSARPPADAESVDRLAAQWFRRHDGGLTDHEREDFARWMAASPQHRAAYVRYEELWRMLDDVAPQNVMTISSVRPGVGRAGRRFWLPAAVAAAAAVVVGAIFFERQPSRLGDRLRIATELGKRDRLALRDGSRVILNGASALAVRFGPTERAIELEAGEAAFAVAHDEPRPFVVRAGPVTVRAIGTEFGVRRHGSVVEVLVTEGRVRVTDERTGRSLLPPAQVPDGILTASQRVVVQLDGGEMPVAQVAAVDAGEMQRAQAWQTGYLHFSAERLDRIVAEFNRYNGNTLEVLDPALSRQTFGGKFPLDDPEALVRVLVRDFGVVAERREGRTLLRLGSPTRE